MKKKNMILLLVVSGENLMGAQGPGGRHFCPSVLPEASYQGPPPSLCRLIEPASEQLVMQGEFERSLDDGPYEIGEQPYSLDLPPYTGQREWDDLENMRPHWWLPRLSLEEENTVLSLMFHPPYQYPRKYVIKLNRGRFLTELDTGRAQGFTTDMTRPAFMWGDRAWLYYKRNELQAIVTARFSSPEEQEAAVRQKHLFNYQIERKFEESGNSVIRLYGTLFVGDASGRFIFFNCRALMEGEPEPVVFQVELANIDDIDQWLVLEGKRATVGMAEEYIRSISMEYL